MKYKIEFTENAAQVREAVKANGGYCCCAVCKIPDTKCMCKEFRDLIADDNFEGECHCGLYRKIKEKA